MTCFVFMDVAGEEDKNNVTWVAAEFAANAVSVAGIQAQKS